MSRACDTTSKQLIVVLETERTWRAELGASEIKQETKSYLISIIRYKKMNTMLSMIKINTPVYSYIFFN